jgi:hypothetical protein
MQRRSPLSFPPLPSFSRPASLTRLLEEGPFDREGSLVRIACESGSDVIEAIQSFLVSYGKLRFRSAVAERVCVAAYELLANGLNYGSISHEVTFELFQRGRVVEVAVTNDATPSRLRMLAGCVAKLRDGAEAVYLEELRRSVAGGFPRAMLGLARVVHEAQMGLDVEVLGESRVTVRACASD